MIRHAFHHRLVAGFSGLWLLATLLEPVPLHACPMHGANGAHHGAAAPPRAETIPAGMHHDHAAMAPGAAAVAGDAAMGSDVVPEHGSPPSPAHSKACVCLGACVGAVAIHLPSAPEVIRARIAIAAVAILAPLRERRVATRADVRLPLATAPPAPSPN